MKNYYCPRQKKLTKTKIIGFELCCAECGLKFRKLNPHEKIAMDLVLGLRTR